MRRVGGEKRLAEGRVRSRWRKTPGKGKGRESVEKNA